MFSFLFLFLIFIFLISCPFKFAQLFAVSANVSSLEFVYFAPTFSPKPSLQLLPF